MQDDRMTGKWFFPGLPFVEGETSMPLMPDSCFPVARHRINHHGSCPDDWYAGDTLCGRRVWAAWNSMDSWYTEKKISVPKIARIDIYWFLMGFCRSFTWQSHKPCPLLIWISSAKRRKFFRMGLSYMLPPLQRGISGSTLQLQWAWWRPCWLQLWDFPGTKIETKFFEKGWLGGGFKHFLFSPLLGEDSHVD